MAEIITPRHSSQDILFIPSSHSSTSVVRSHRRLKTPEEASLHVASITMSSAIRRKCISASVICQRHFFPSRLASFSEYLTDALHSRSRSWRFAQLSLSIGTSLALFIASYLFALLPPVSVSFSC